MIYDLIMEESSLGFLGFIEAGDYVGSLQLIGLLLVLRLVRVFRLSEIIKMES